VLPITCYNHLFAEYARRISQCQIIGDPAEVAVVFGFLHSDGLEEEGFPLHGNTQDAHFPLTRSALCLPNLKLAPLSKCPNSPPPSFTSSMR
jgi:hypothetical protein